LATVEERQFNLGVNFGLVESSEELAFIEDRKPTARGLLG
jgi:hypothetical protein